MWWVTDARRKGLASGPARNKRQQGHVGAQSLLFHLIKRQIFPITVIIAANSLEFSVIPGWGHHSHHCWEGAGEGSRPGSKQGTNLCRVEFSTQASICCSEFSCLAEATEISVHHSFLISADDTFLLSPTTGWRRLHHWFLLINQIVVLRTLIQIYPLYTVCACVASCTLPPNNSNARGCFPCLCLCCLHPPIKV